MRLRKEIVIWEKYCIVWNLPENKDYADHMRRSTILALQAYQIKRFKK